jgi:hypothetical protein
MPAYVVTGPKGPETVDYGIVRLPRRSLRCTLYTPMASALAGCASTATAWYPPSCDDQQICAGVWRVIEVARNGKAGGVEITVPPPISAHG